MKAKKTYKFLILCNDWDDFPVDTTKDILEKYVRVDSAHMWVIECHHEAFEDNVVTVGKDEDCSAFDLVKDVDGFYYYPEEWWSRQEVIDSME